MLKLIALLALASFVSSAFAVEDWLCKEVASQRSGNLIKSCGVGIGADENEARATAFENAKKEFGRVCTISSDCRGRSITVQPERTSCEKDQGKCKCYRLIVFSIGDMVKDAGFEATKEVTSADLVASSPTDAPPAKPVYEPLNIDQKETLKPFFYREIASLPKIKVGMPKMKVLAKFGKPSSVRESEDSVLVHYKDKSFCESGRCSFRFDPKTGKVTTVSDFKFEYTEMLK